MCRGLPVGSPSCFEQCLPEWALPASSCDLTRCAYYNHPAAPRGFWPVLWWLAQEDNHKFPSNRAYDRLVKVWSHGAGIWLSSRTLAQDPSIHHQCWVHVSGVIWVWVIIHKALLDCELTPLKKRASKFKEHYPSAFCFVGGGGLIFGFCCFYSLSPTPKMSFDLEGNSS